MLSKLTVVALVAVFSLSPPPQAPAEELAAIKKELAELKAAQAAMQKDLQAIKNFLQAVQQQQQRQAQGPELQVVGQTIDISGEPTLGSPTAQITLVEVSDYHCPFCRRNVQQTFPQINAEFIRTGKARYVFVDYPIAQLHPDAARSHEAAACAGDQGKFWEMHNALFSSTPLRDADALTSQAAGIGLDVAKFRDCLTAGKHTAAIRDSVARVQKLGIGGTPATLIGMTPAPGTPMKIIGYVYGARPYADFKKEIETALGK